MKFKEKLIKKWCGRTTDEIHTLENELEEWKQRNADLLNDVDELKVKLSCWEETAKIQENKIRNYELKEKHYSEHTVKIVPQYIDFETFKMKVEMPDRDMKDYEEKMNYIVAQQLANDLIEKGYIDYTEQIDPFKMKRMRIYELLVAKKG